MQAASRLGARTTKSNALNTFRRSMLGNQAFLRRADLPEKDLEAGAKLCLDEDGDYIHGAVCFSLKSKRLAIRSYLILSIFCYH